MHQVPRRRNRKLEMRIVSQDRFSGGRASSRNHPRIRSRLRLGAGARREKKLHFSAVAALDHVGLDQLGAPRRGERAVHLESNQNRVAHLPGTRVVVEQLELERQPSAMRVHKEIDAARVGCEQRAIAGRQRAFLLLRDAPQPEPARVFVLRDQRFSEHLRQHPRRQPPHCIQLPQAVLRGHVALEKDGVLPGSRRDVRHSPYIARDGSSRRDRSRDLAGGLRQGPPHEPVGRRHKRDQQNGYAQIDRSKQRGGEHCSDCKRIRCLSG